MTTDQITLLTVIISSICTVVGNYFVYLKRSRVNLEEQAKRYQFYADKIQAIDKKLDEHNNYANLFQKNAKDISDIKADNKLMWREIADLTDDIKEIKEDLKNVQMCKINKK